MTISVSVMFSETNESKDDPVTSQYQSDIEENDDPDDLDYIPETDYSDDSNSKHSLFEVS